MNKMPLHVMDKDGNAITKYVYDDWNEYVIAYILSRHHPGVYFTPILAEEYKKTECKYEAIYYFFKANFNVSNIEFLKSLQLLITDDTYCIISYVEDKKGYFGYYDYVEDYQLEDLGDYQLHDYFDKIAFSEEVLTRNFENNPMKAYVRLSIRRNDYSRDSKYREEVVKIYWIYAFQLKMPLSYVQHIPIERIDVKKLLKDMIGNGYSEYYEIILKGVERLEETLKEQHQKEIEELLAPGGAAYQVVKERFEKTRETRETQKDGLD